MNKRINSHHVVKILLAAVFAVLILPVTATAQGNTGMSIDIRVPQAVGLKENQRELPFLVQRAFINTFSSYMPPNSIPDKESIDRRNRDLMSGRYDDATAAALITTGREIPTTHYMDGTITRKTAGLELEMKIYKGDDHSVVARHIGNSNHFDLKEGPAVRRASLDLLPQIGVTLTASARQELAGTADAGRTALARATIAERRGSEVAALSHYLEAAAFNPSLTDAAKRASILLANISSGRMGDNIRGDIEWRRQWLERLKETEEFIDDFTNIESIPYTLFYVMDGIRQHGQINYQNETVSMVMGVHLHASGIWTLSIERTLQAIYDGLRATGKAAEWGFGNWPQQGVTNLNPLERHSENFDVTFELLNDKNRVISRASLRTSGSWELNRRGRPTINVSTSTSIQQTNDRISHTHVQFGNIRANDISDHMTVRVASINGAAAEDAAIDGFLQIQAITQSDFLSNAGFRFERGELRGFAQRPQIPRGHFLEEIDIPSTIWGDPVISIGDRAFANIPTPRINIPGSVTSIGSETFVTDQLNSLTIGANVMMKLNSFAGKGFYAFTENYNQNGKQANTYFASDFRFVNGEIQGFDNMAVSTENRAAVGSYGRRGSHGLNNSSARSKLVIPDSIWGNPVISIANGAFKNEQGRSIMIPNGITYIGSEAFFLSDEISSITIGENVAMEENSIKFSFQVTAPDGQGVKRTFMRTYSNFWEYYVKNGKKAGTYHFVCRSGSDADYYWHYGTYEEAIKEGNKKNLAIILGAIVSVVILLMVGSKVSPNEQ